MLDRQWMLEREERRDREQREWQKRESNSNKQWRTAEFVIAVIGVGLIVLAAFIERSGQPTTINQIMPVSVETQIPTPSPAGQ